MRFSFEFFPPSTEKGYENLEQTIQNLSPFAPDFLSVTYGAGGANRQKTFTTLERLSMHGDYALAGHLTMVGQGRGEILDVARQYRDKDIKHIVALRGDLPEGEGELKDPHFRYAWQLVEALKKENEDFFISVAAYPEKHPEAETFSQDLDNLKRKQDAGANQAITQFCFDPDQLLRFRDRAVSAGITIPILAGVLPISNFNQTVKFAKQNGASLPGQLVSLFDQTPQPDPHVQQHLSALVTSYFCSYLQRRGFEDLHFYTLNRYPLTQAICRFLTLFPLDRGVLGDVAQEVSAQGSIQTV